YWESPWGRGRPGWHMECSVMSTKYLGKSFDIHGGGEDLLFPHHENERAQSICAQGGEFARYWVHNGFVTMEGEKMSKSLGNFLTIRDAIKEYHPELLRLFLLSKHYRSPIDFRRDSVIALQSALIRLYRMIERLERLWGKDRIKQIKEEKEENDSDLSRFLNYLKDDINTAGAIGVLFDKVRALNRSIDRLEKEEDSGTEDMERGLSSIFQMADILGILNEEPKEFFERLHPELASLDMEKIERMIAERADARAKKDFQKADAIRDELRSMGIILEDSPRGTVWRLDV
ncbi:MAG TPA: cysteine--tRNA ligase, partial [Desulfobacteraceae bacterium]|nr:cysteine--tRNA ligase [Desulfobacteraceae bacterium]